MFFCADLVRRMTMDVALDFHRDLELRKSDVLLGCGHDPEGPQLVMRGKSVLIVENIIDSGLSIREVNNYIESRVAPRW